jgi:ribosomal protein S18 acetylase RimI-like enzyme
VSAGVRAAAGPLDGDHVITIRHMARSELDRIGEIDRSEHVTQEYSYRGGSLEARSVDIAVPTWSRAGDHEHSVQGKIDAWQPILDQGATLVGAFDASLVGIAIYRPALAEAMANLAVLHVSRNYRRNGIASLLVEEVVRLARGDGARHLYVSATPSGAAIGFYRNHGFEPTAEPNEALFALEPDDIHMILEL